MSDYGQCCRATSKHTSTVNIFCTAQSTSLKLHLHELPDSQEPLQSRHLWHLKIQPHSVIWHTCICNKLNLGIFLQPSGHGMEDFPLYLQGVLQLFPATFWVHWQIREFLFNFCISTESGVFCCYRDFLTTRWALTCVFFPTTCASRQDPSAQLQLHSALWEQWQVPPLPTVQAWGELWIKAPNCLNSM